MKVLFAVNDENISASIVKKYQKQYKEIISYKNVYYFNAILKELQKNKSYDRVIISEDLEEFTSSSYSQKDKFIFDRLDSITDEAVSQDGTDIPIILICSERRNKSEDILVRLFGIGIYNAIIGDDRSVDEVCRLIYKPRSKKEAKVYYKIQSEQVVYEKEKDNEVSETEMQNILMHFKKIGNNEDKYIDSFKNILSQYNDEQMKVIIAVLPNHVKEVLEERSKDYQRIVYPNGVQKQEISKKKSSNKKKTNEKLLNANTGMKLTRPVVVPTTIDTNIYKKVDAKKKINIDLDDLEDIDDIEDVDTDLPELEVDETPRRRGRPRKNPAIEENELTNREPRRRGRPRKNPIEEDNDEDILDDFPGFDDPDDDVESSILPGFDEENEEEEKFENQNKNDYDEYEDDDEYEDNNDNDDEYEKNDDYDNYDEEIDDLEQSQEEDYKADQNELEDDYNYSHSRSTTAQERSMEQYNGNSDFNEAEFESLLSGDKKIVSFVGTSKNGTSFIVNNVAQILANTGIDTAILDVTKNKNSYYIYTKNDEELRKTAIKSIPRLLEGHAEGIKVSNKLTVYTNIPSQSHEISNPYQIMETLLKNHALVLIDSDFETPIEYFAKSQELYLVQSMDVLTIQPLTAFLRELKVKKVLQENKIRIVLNKLIRIRGITGKNIIGGMSNYNDPEMSFMTELFDRNIVKIAAQIPFDEDVYAKYLEGLVDCEIKTNGYPKEFKQRLNNLAETIYPLLPNKNSKGKYGRDNRGGGTGYPNSFSSDMNNTLDNMRKRY